MANGLQCFSFTSATLHGVPAWNCETRYRRFLSSNCVSTLETIRSRRWHTCDGGLDNRGKCTGCGSSRSRRLGGEKGRRRTLLEATQPQKGAWEQKFLFWIPTPQKYSRAGVVWALSCNFHSEITRRLSQSFLASRDELRLFPWFVRLGANSCLPADGIYA